MVSKQAGCLIFLLTCEVKFSAIIRTKVCLPLSSAMKLAPDDLPLFYDVKGCGFKCLASNLPAFCFPFFVWDAPPSGVLF